MEWSIFFTMVVFAFAMAGSPGPNNVLLTYNGANFGVKRGMPQLFGIVLGIASMILLMGMGLNLVFQSHPFIQISLKVFGSLYLAYLALKILQQTQIKTADNSGSRPMFFLESFGFQYLNPKAWLMTSSAVASFSMPGDKYWLSIACLVLAFAIVNPITGTIWLSFGRFISMYLSQAHALRRFNLSMSIATLACIGLLWI